MSPPNNIFHLPTRPKVLPMPSRQELIEEHQKQERYRNQDITIVFGEIESLVESLQEMVIHLNALRRMRDNHKNDVERLLSERYEIGN